MKVETFYITDRDNFGEDEAFICRVDGEEVFHVRRGEPEDACLGRDLNFVFKLPDLIREAFDAGKNGENIEFIHNILNSPDDYYYPINNKVKQTSGDSD